MRTTDNLEQAVADLWAEALGEDEISLDDDFFELGGNSITAIRLLPETSERFGVEPGIGLVFDNPTPRQMAAALREIGAQDGR